MSAAAENGWAVGEMWGDRPRTTVRWHAGQAEEIGLAFDRATTLKDVNSAGVAVGWAGFSDDRQAIVYRNGQYAYLPFPGDKGNSYALAVNNAGDAVGMVEPTGKSRDIVVWPGSGGAPRVITLPGDYAWTYAADIDEQGRALVYGAYRNAWGYDAYVWSPSGTVTKVEPADKNNPTVLPERLRNNRVLARTGHGDTWTEFHLDTGEALPYDTTGTSMVIDSGYTTAGVVNDYANSRQNLTVWEHARVKQVLATADGWGDPLQAAGLTDDGTLAFTQRTGATTRASTFTRHC
ncbi:hypothetical protein [Actinocrispum sp. NPDC049592]|uniref:hypothetical protein n=1 Tax=Actinocrispum sp. NPDC049592 TaxID=3154835 RepID=UPI0034447994